ncbi:MULTISPECIES: hypothetical protein [Acidovorax]|uniref:hypothetical protein n=1 Tax=Acidovorax TaxID=12916 RepID=UPI000A5BA8BC|nr:MULTISPECIES: hypothetical protein [Acidovorax]MBP3979914.1 hypothetical protein [Acidovorax sp. JG5]
MSNHATRAPIGRPLGSLNKPKPHARPTNVVPAAQYDRMRAPVWTAIPAAPVRAGALNHMSIESRGFRC